MGNIQVLERLSQNIKNEASVLGQIVTEAPGAIWDEIRKDWQQDRMNLLERAAIAVGIGTAAGILLSRSPVLGRLAIGIPTTLYGFRAASGATSVVGRAWHADTVSEREALAQEAVAKVGRHGASALEEMPALMLGGGAGVWTSRRIAALDRLAFRVTESVEFPVRRLVPEKVSWVGPGTERLPPTLMKANGRLDILELSEMLAKRHPWQGVETIRSIRLSDLKASRPMNGTPVSNELGFLDRPGRVVFHTHPELLTVNGRPVFGARPGIEDLGATMDLGIVRSGDLTTIYRGAHREFAAAKSAGTTFEPRLNAVVIDAKSQLAFELDSVWSAAKRDFLPSVPRPLNYAEAIKVLSNWDRKWSSIQSIATDTGALTHPFMYKLMELGVY